MEEDDQQAQHQGDICAIVGDNGGQLLQVLHQSNGAGSRSAVGVFKIGRKKDRRSERKIWQQNLIFSPVLLKRCLA